MAVQRRDGQTGFYTIRQRQRRDGQTGFYAIRQRQNRRI
jgi:hypothetical protein